MGAAMSAEDRQKAIKAFKDKNPGKKLPPSAGGGLAHGQIKEKPVEAPVATVEAPEARLIEDKTFQAIPCKQGNLEAYIVVLSMADVVDYTCYASDFYEVVGDDEETPATGTWQRVLNTKRASKEIMPYLLNSLHFFPSLVCVPQPEGIQINDDGTVTLSVVLDDDGIATAPLGTLDGQHRRAGIESLLSKSGPDSDFAQEQISCIIITSEMTIDDRQQVFADINRTAKVVSKALNILYDHRDQYAVISHDICKSLGDVVDLTRTTPKPTSSNACTLSNVYSMVINFGAMGEKPSGSMREGLTPAIIHDVVVSMIKSLPAFDRLAANTDKNAPVRQAYAAYWSTFFQAMGNAARHATMGLPVESMPDLVGKLCKLTKWEISNPVFAPVITKNAKGQYQVGTRSEHVAAASGILEAMWATLKVDAEK